MELAKHGTTRKALEKGVKAKTKRKSNKAKEVKTASGPGQIHNITKPKEGQFKIYASGNCLLCQVKCKGELVGWGDDFFLVDNDGKITSFNLEGDKLGSVKYSKSREYIGSVRKNGFTIVKSSNSNNKKVYKSDCTEA